MKERRSKKLRAVKVKTPTKVKIAYKRRKPQKAKCGNCGKPLKGVPREIPSKLNKLAKTERRPERPYGGVLCSKCMRDVFINKARQGE